MEVPMAMGRPKATLELSSGQRQQLESIAGSRSLPAGLVNRARIVLMSAAGETNQQIARRLGLSQATVGKWRRRFLQQDVTGLHDELRPGRPRSIGDESIARLLARLRLAASSHRTASAVAAGCGPAPESGSSRPAASSPMRC